MLELTENQALWFRARRGHLAGPGARNAAAAARAVLGAQGQQLAPALRALSLRTRGRPTAAALSKRLLDGPRELVWTWGQRETLHVYDAATHWADVAAARAEWAPGGRRGPMPDPRTLDRALAKMVALERPVTRTDLLGVAPKRYEPALAAVVDAGMPTDRLAAARLVWCLALRGDVCVAGKLGAEQGYATRASRRRAAGSSASPTSSSMCAAVTVAG